MATHLTREGYFELPYDPLLEPLIQVQDSSGASLYDFKGKREEHEANTIFVVGLTKHGGLARALHRRPAELGMHARHDDIAVGLGGPSQRSGDGILRVDGRAVPITWPRAQRLPDADLVGTWRAVDDAARDRLIEAARAELARYDDEMAQWREWEALSVVDLAVPVPR